LPVGRCGTTDSASAPAVRHLSGSTHRRAAQILPQAGGGVCEASCRQQVAIGVVVEDHAGRRELAVRTEDDFVRDAGPHFIVPEKFPGFRKPFEVRGTQTLSGLHLSHVSPGMRALPGNGPGRKSIWRLVIPIAVLALVIGTTLGEVCHHHDANTSAENCPICHLSHQAAEPVVASVRAEIRVPEGPRPEPLPAAFVSRLVAPQVPARAPPAQD
jgi:hypothetical protein